LIIKKKFSINIKTFLLNVLLIFFIGFAFRIVIHHCLGVNFLSNYINNILILYYFGLSTFLVYFDQFFSYQYNVLTNAEPNNIIKSFNNDSKTFNLLFTKDHNNSSSLQYSTDHSSRHSKVGSKLITTNGKYSYLRPVINNKGDMILVPGLDIGKHSSNSLPSRDNLDSIYNMPPKPKPSNLSTPSTMSPLFPNTQQNNKINESYHSYSRSPLPFNMSRESKWYTTTEPSIKVSAETNLGKKYRRDTLDTADLADRRRKIIESVQFKIKEYNKSKPNTNTSICDKVSSSLNYLDSKVVSKLLNKPTGNMDPKWSEIVEESKHKKQLYEQARREEFRREYNERMANYCLRLRKNK